MAIQPGWGSQWETLANAINDYFGGGVDSAQYQSVVQMLNNGNYTPAEMDSILKQIPEFQTTYNANGELISVAYKNTMTQGASTSGNIAQTINSNAANGTATQFSSVQTITKNPTTGTATVSDSVTKYSAGTAGSAKAVIGSALTGILAAGVGIKLGKQFAQAAYDHGFNYLSWAGVDLESINPQVWSTIITQDNPSALAPVFNMLFLLDPETNNPQPYIDENVFAYLTSYLAQTGAITDSNYIWDGDKPLAFDLEQPIYSFTYSGIGLTRSPSGFIDWTFNIDHMHQDSKTTSTISSSRGLLYGLLTSKTSFATPQGLVFFEGTREGEIVGGGSTQQMQYTYDNRTVYYAAPRLTNPISGYETNPYNFEHDNVGQLAWVLQYGDFDTTGIPGISTQPGATVFDPSQIQDLSDISTVLTELKNQYPELWDERVEFSTDGDNKHVYIPVGFPTGGVDGKTTTEGATQNDLAPNIKDQGDNATDELVKTILEMIQKPGESVGMKDKPNVPTTPTNPNDPGTGTGTTPTVIIPSGSASALYSIYNPTQSEVNSLGAWLWSSDFVDQLLKLFNDPMQAIIGLHKVFVNPPVSGRGDIKVGYLNSGVSANLVSGQYVDVDCGTVNLKEKFKNVFDYDPFTNIFIYLPFIGIQKLNTGDVMRGSINVKYHVDVLTGACLAEIKVTRDASGGTLYTYAGNCAVQYPLSSGSYMGIVASALSIAGGIAGTIASGGAAAPMALGAVSGALNAHTQVSHSGNFSGNAGAMGIKKPYLIITRPQTMLAASFDNYQGIPSNHTTILGSCSGYVKCVECHLENIPATNQELSQIETLLKTGVLI